MLQIYTSATFFFAFCIIFSEISVKNDKIANIEEKVLSYTRWCLTEEIAVAFCEIRWRRETYTIGYL